VRTEEHRSIGGATSSPSIASFPVKRPISCAGPGELHTWANETRPRGATRAAERLHSRREGSGRCPTRGKGIGFARASSGID
jgi:hypothetical protein